MDTQHLALAAACFVIAVLLVILRQRRASGGDHKAKSTDLAQGFAEKDSSSTDQDTYPPVEPLPDFEWAEEEPFKLRPFKPLYHLTMGVVNTDVSHLIEMDKNYLDRITKRRQLMDDHPEIVLGAYDRVKPAVDEFYIWLLGTYLPTRYPRMFTLCRSQNDDTDGDPVPIANSSDGDDPAPTHLRSNVTQEFYSLKPPQTAVEVLKAIGGIVEDDCQFLLPAEDGDGYALAGFVCCFPSGFKMSKKLGLKLRDIHTPVPHYKEKLEKSMDRYMAKLEVGKFVRRNNWTVSTTTELFNPKGNHIHEGDVVTEVPEYDMTQAIMRSELQTVHRLPRSKAILFNFKTYSYSLQEIKDEGSGEDLIAATEGMKNGSAPDMYRYKSALRWGEQVKAFLRS